MTLKVTAAAHPNLPLVKYWGNTDDALNLPANDSISFNLSGATTITSVYFDASRDTDAVAINGRPADAPAYDRVVRHLDRVRALAETYRRAVVESRNDFPASAGVASSSSAFAALSLAASRAAGLELDARALSILARKGSGSACRSVIGGFVEWVAGADDATSYARQIAPAAHWELRAVTVIVDTRPKQFSSTEGHRTAHTSPFYRARLEALPQTLAAVRAALAAKDFTALGRAVEREAVSLHVVAMTASPPGCGWCSGIYYWQPETLRLIHALQGWRGEGLEVYFTADAGANLHLLCEAKDLPALETRLDALLPDVGGRYFVSRPGRGAWVVAEEEA